MRRMRLSKWDGVGVAIAALLFVGLVGFRAYINGYPVHLCPSHHVPMHRVWVTLREQQSGYKVWISDGPIPPGYVAVYTKFGPPEGLHCNNTEIRHDWWNFYFYCPESQKSQGMCN